MKARSHTPLSALKNDGHASRNDTGTATANDHKPPP